MAQATFLFETHAPAQGGSRASATGRTSAGTARPEGADGIGFEIGWDFARHRLVPPLAHLHAQNPVRQGWSAGRAVFGARTLRPGPWVRPWLQLRLAAWQHGQAFEEVQVTPHFLAQLATPQCPVTHQSIACAEPGSTSASPRIVRLNPAAAVAAGNLVLLSPAAADAAEACTWEQAQANARRIEAGETVEIGGLGAEAWQRLAGLMSLATPLPHAQAAQLPLRVLPPNRVRVINPVQALQTMLTLQFCEAGYARRLVALAVLMPSAEARHGFQVLMHTLLARRLAAGPVLDRAAARRALEAAWGDALVQRRWQRLVQWLSAADCELLLERAAQRGLMAAGSQWLAQAPATDGWALASAGQAPTPTSAEGVVSAKARLSH